MIRTALTAATLGALAASAASASQVDITNGDGTIPNQFLSSNGGLDSDDFTTTSGNGVSVALRARNDRFNPDGGGDDPTVTPGSASAGSSATYTLNAPASATGSGFKFEFQFSPRDGDTTNENYFLELTLDNDPTAGTNFEADNTFSGFVFDADSDDELLDSGRFGPGAAAAVDRSWDDGDSVIIDGVTSKGGTIVDFNNPTGGRDNLDLPDYVVANSWRAGWNFPSFSLLGDDVGAPRGGLFDLRLMAFENDGGNPGRELASVQVTADVAAIPLPAGGVLLLTALGGLGGARVLCTRRKAG